MNSMMICSLWMALALTFCTQGTPHGDIAALLSKIGSGEGANFTRPSRYYGRTNPNPEDNMNFCEIAHYHGYACEEYLHQIVTKDGFLLTLHRLNGRKGAKVNSTRVPVFVQHGLLCDSASWILNLPNQSLPFILSDNGYDVWLGNSRGNTYSRAHKTLKDSQAAFWAWSWDEMAIYDLPASLDFVLSHTGYSKLPYIGHSQGTMMAFVHLATTTDTRISHLIALGPVFHVAHLISPIRYLSPISTDLFLALEIFGFRDFLPNNWIIKLLAETVCERYDPLRVVCADLVFALAGFDFKQLNQSRLSVYLTNTPAGTSVRNILHFAQMYESKKCTRFNYGCSWANRKHYGTSTPPAYNLTSFNTPVSLFSAQNDWLADPKDVQYIIANLHTLKHNVYIPNWDHLDFMWAMDAATVVYDKVVKILRLEVGPGKT